MNWFSTIKRYFDRNLWTKLMVGDAVTAGKITSKQYKEITSEDFVVNANFYEI